MAKEKLESAGCMWLNLKADGKVSHININLGEEKFVGFPNDLKKNDNEPDYNIYKNRPKEND